MEKLAPNSKFVGHSTEIIRQSKIKGPLFRLYDPKHLVSISNSNHAKEEGRSDTRPIYHSCLITLHFSHGESAVNLRIAESSDQMHNFHTPVIYLAFPIAMQ